MTSDPEQAETEALRQRLRSADPARSVTPPDGLAADLVRRTREHAMSDQQQPDPDGRRRRWLPLAAAAAVLAVGGTAYVATQGGDDSAAPPTAAEPTVTELALPTGDPPGRCMQVNAQTVANAETALEGTVTTVEDDQVVLEVTRWFVGGSADEVMLSVPSLGPAPLALPGQPEFGTGERWLVTAADGRVNACGFTAPWSADLADVFVAAFPG